MESIIGQPLAVDLCRRWLAKETTHPLLLYGPDGVGKRTLALEVAKTLNKETHKTSTGQHPDVRVVNLAYQASIREEPIEKQQALRIETVLGERRRLLQSAVEGQWKVSIIDDAHRLTPDAANVLLKILEEPPAHTAIFLVTPFRDRLFPTLLSRCQPVRFKPLSDEEMQQVLSQQGVAEELHMRLIELALGSPGRALHMNRAEQIEAVRDAETLWQNLPKHKPSEIVRQLDGRGRARVTRQDVEEQVTALMIPAIRDLRSGQTQAAKPVRLLQAALMQLRQNVQPAMVLDTLMLRLSKR